MNYEALRAECDERGMGPLLWQLLVDVCARASRKYPPDPYNHGEPWTEEAHRDLALEVSLERLLGESQLDYVLAMADEAPQAERADALARLLTFQVRRVLNHRRSITVVDRLYGRVKALVRSELFHTTPVGPDIAVSRTDDPRDARVLTESEVRHGGRLIDSIPRLPSRPGSERESKVYNAADLEDLVTRLVDAFGAVLLGDIRKILEIALTAWLPAVLRDDEEDHVSGSSPELELERTLMTQLIDTLARALDPTLRLVLIGKSQGIADGDLAIRVGRSRPWLADRKVEVLGRVQQELIAELPEELHDDAVRGLIDAVVALQGTES